MTTRDLEDYSENGLTEAHGMGVAASGVASPTTQIPTPTSCRSGGRSTAGRT